MKAERRHELRENDLAHTLTLARDFFEVHSKQITLVALGALVVFAVVSFAIRSRAASHQASWRDKQSLNFQGVKEGRNSLDALLGMVADSSDEKFIMDGLLDAGRQALRLAREVPFPPDRDFNQKARQAFEDLMRRFPREAIPMGVALSGLATVEENEFLLDHDPAHKEKARAYLDRITADPLFNGLPFQRLALDRLKTLDQTFQVIEFAPPPPPQPVDEETEGDAAVDKADEAPPAQPAQP